MATLLHQRLSDAANAGDIDDLYLVFEQNSLILEVIDQNPFTETPLHVAVAAGKTCFVEEITNLKPSFARKLNTSGYSPLHLAATNGHVEIVKQLLTVDSCLAQLKARERRTPLHCAAIAGSIEVLDELIFNCPKSLEMLTTRKETALHLAVKHGQVEVIEVLLNWIKELQMEKLLSWTDQEGNTVLHLATSSRQYQVVKMLCNGSKLRRAAKVNARNNSGLTALDLDESQLRHPNEPLDVLSISDILHNAGSKRAHDLIINMPPSPPTKQPRLAVRRRQRIWHRFNLKVPKDTSLEVRGTLLVILVLITTATFEIGTTPPGGIWQDDSNDHVSGNPIWMRKDPVGYFIFSTVNFVGFVMSSVLIIGLVEGYPYVFPIRLAQSLLIFTYVWSAAPCTDVWSAAPWHIPSYWLKTPSDLFYILSTILKLLSAIGFVALLWLRMKRM